MHIPSSPTRRPSQARLLSRLRRGLAAPGPSERGQALVLMTLAFLSLLAFVGLVTDVGALYNAFGQLRRSVDAAGLAAAVQFRETGNLATLTTAAQEALEVNGVANATATVLICDNNGDDYNDDPSLITAPSSISQAAFEAEFSLYCQPIGGKVSRKFVWVFARQTAPVYFLQLFGIQAVPLTSYSISEAATLDIVLVLDTSQSMAIQPCDSTGTPDPGQPPCNTDTSSSLYDLPNASTTSCAADIAGCDIGNYAKFCNQEPADISDPNPADPSTETGGADGLNACYPFYLVKDAARRFINKVNFPYDQVAIVTFDGERQDLPGTYNNGVDGFIYTGPIYGFPPSARLAVPLTSTESSLLSAVSLDPAVGNPIKVYEQDESYKAFTASPNFDVYPSPGGDGLVDYFDLNWFCSAAPGGPASFGDYSGSLSPNPLTDTQVANFVTRYCTGSNVGGGMRVASEHLKQFGRPSSVWLIIFLADGYTNLSDLPPTPNVPVGLSAGFCRGPNHPAGSPAADFPDGWYMVRPLCTDNRILTRYCADAGVATCPPNHGQGPGITTVIYDGPNFLKYNVEDYARDMADGAALQVNCIPSDPCDRTALYNSSELPLGSSISIFSVGLGGGITSVSPNLQDDNANLTAAAAMLRYFAAVGDDGDRQTDPCNPLVAGVPVLKPVTESCGNYYYSPNATKLAQIFDAIAEKVFIRISQ